MAGRKHLVCPARWADNQNTQNALIGAVRVLRKNLSGTAR